jgi:hypothetical protein
MMTRISVQLKQAPRELVTVLRLRRLIEFTREVRTPAGSAFFHEPIGTPITEEEYAAAKRANANARRRASAKGSVTQVRGARDNLAKREDDKRIAQGQTKSNFMHPVTGNPMTKSEIGDTYEAIFQQKGAALLAKKYPGEFVPISHADGGARNTPLDFLLNHTFGGELKTLSSRSANQKTAIKKDEIDRKLRAIAGKKMSPLLAVQVVDQDTGTVSVYTYPNFVSKMVRSMEYLGSYQYTQEDFKNAQVSQGYWKDTYSAAK